MIFVSPLDAQTERAYLVSDASRAELLTFGKQIGLRESFLKQSGEVYEHFSLSPTMREIALKHGASEASRREIRAASWRRAASEKPGSVPVLDSVPPAGANDTAHAPDTAQGAA